METLSWLVGWGDWLMLRLVRPRVSMRALLALVALVALGLGLVIVPGRRQQQAITALRLQGAEVSTQPSWLGRRFGLPFFENATSIIFLGRPDPTPEVL